MSDPPVGDSCTTCPPNALPPEPRASTMLLAVPIVLGGFLLLGGLGILVLGRLTGGPGGDRVTARYAVDCADAVPDTVLSPAELATGQVIDARARALGMGEPHISQKQGELDITATLPGAADDLQVLSALLARPGRFTLRLDGRDVASRVDLVQAQAATDGAGLPVTELVLAPSTAQRLAQALASADQAGVWASLDGQPVSDEPLALDHDRLALPSGSGLLWDRTRRARRRAIILNNGPLPCALSLISAQPVSGDAR